MGRRAEKMASARAFLLETIKHSFIHTTSERSVLALFSLFSHTTYPKEQARERVSLYIRFSGGVVSMELESEVVCIVDTSLVVHT